MVFFSIHLIWCKTDESNPHTSITSLSPLHLENPEGNFHNENESYLMSSDGAKSSCYNLKMTRKPGGNGVKQVFPQPGNIRRSHQNIVLLSLSADCCVIELDYQKWNQSLSTRTPTFSLFLLDDVINDESVLLPSINFIALNMFITLVDFLSVFFSNFVKIWRILIWWSHNSKPCRCYSNTWCS